MKTVQVTYTVQESYADQNKMNITQVMNDLRATGRDGIHYSSYVKEDGVTFVHVAHFATEEDNKVLNDLDSFKHFQQELKASGLVNPPAAQTLEMIGSSNNTLHNY